MRAADIESRRQVEPIDYGMNNKLAQLPSVRPGGRLIWHPAALSAACIFLLERTEEEDETTLLA